MSHMGSYVKTWFPSQFEKVVFEKVLETLECSAQLEESGWVLGPDACAVSSPFLFYSLLLAHYGIKNDPTIRISTQCTWYQVITS